MMSLSTFGILFLTILGHSLAYDEFSEGSGGDVCGPRTCLKGKAQCMGTECSCLSPFVFGDGVLNCYKKNEFRTEVTNDPEIKTYNNNTIDLPVPCRYLLTHTVTEYKDRNRNVVGGCEAMVHAFHKKKFGKFYVAGFDIAIRIECNNGSRYQMSIRKYGHASTGRYDVRVTCNFYINATDGEFWPNGPYHNDVINFYDSKTNLRIKCKIDENNNLAMVEVKKCGFRIRFRGYDINARREQRGVPGIAFAVNCAHHVEFESVDKVLALPPIGAHNGFTIHSIEIPGLGKMGTMMYRAYMSGIEQTQPNPNMACAAARDSVAQCVTLPQKQMAFNNCVWILRSARFIRCYDHTDNGYYIQALFNMCVDTYCAGTVTCHDVVGEIASKGCLDVPRYPKKDNYINNCVI